MNESHETDAIRQRMEEVRCDLDKDVQEIVEGARDMSNWRTYVRKYPWVCVGAAVAVGYLVVPRRAVAASQPDAQTLAELAKQSPVLVQASSPPKTGVRSALLTFVGNIVLRRVLSYAGQQADQFFAQLANKSQPAAGPPQDDRHEAPHS